MPITFIYILATDFLILASVTRQTLLLGLPPGSFRLDSILFLDGSQKVELVKCALIFQQTLHYLLGGTMITVMTWSWPGEHLLRCWIFRKTYKAIVCLSLLRCMDF